MMKILALPPYHLFKYRGSRYVLDIETSTVMQLDAPAYDALRLRAEGASPETQLAELTAPYGAETAQTVLRELDWLEGHGLFRAPLQTCDDAENEAYIQQLVRMGTGNIELDLAEACNLHCRYCYMSDNDALHHGLMPWEIARQAIDLVFTRGAAADKINITFFGGEPLLNKPVLKQAIAYCQQLGAERGKTVTYSMTTNGTLLDDEVIDLIKQYNFGLMVSLDGPPEVHNVVRPFANGEGSFAAAAAGIRRLMARRSSVTVRCTLSNRCLDRPRIVQFLEDFGFTRVAMSRCAGRVDNFGLYDIGPEENAVLAAQDDFFIERLFAQLKRGEPVRFNPWAGVVRDIHDAQNRRMRCGVGRGCTTVGIDGALYPCHRYVGMPAFILGHVSTGIDRERFTAYLRGYFATKRKCEDCWAINLCGGYCPWHVSCADGTFAEPQDWWCAELRGWFERGVWLYETLRAQYPEYLSQLVGEEVAPLLW